MGRTCPVLSAVSVGWVLLIRVRGGQATRRQKALCVLYLSQAHCGVGNIIQEELEPFQEGENGNCLDFYQGNFPGAERQPGRQHGTLSREPCWGWEAESVSGVKAFWPKLQLHSNSSLSLGNPQEAVAFSCIQWCLNMFLSAPHMCVMCLGALHVWWF